jgi:peptidoglycan LD-endopeptidase CwlK
MQTPQAFQVVYGIRTPAAEAEAVATGHSETMHSRHLAGGGLDAVSAYGGMAMAADIACLVGSNISWEVADPTGGIYGVAARQILANASKLGIAVQWGGQEVGAWTDCVPSHFRDWGHFQLDPSKYP